LDLATLFTTSFSFSVDSQILTMPQTETDYKACMVTIIGGELRRTPNTVPDTEDISTWNGCSTIESVCINKPAGYTCDHPEEGVEIVAHDPHDGPITWEDETGFTHHAFPRSGKSTLHTTRIPNSPHNGLVSIIVSTEGWEERQGRVEGDDCSDLWPDHVDDGPEEQDDDSGVTTPISEPQTVGRPPYIVR
jgi:hypothetical protein